MTRKQKLYEAIAIVSQTYRTIENLPSLKFSKDLADEMWQSHKLALDWVGGLHATLMLMLDRELRKQRSDK